MGEDGEGDEGLVCRDEVIMWRISSSEGVRPSDGLGAGIGASSLMKTDSFCLRGG